LSVSYGASAGGLLRLYLSHAVDPFSKLDGLTRFLASLYPALRHRAPPRSAVGVTVDLQHRERAQGISPDRRPCKPAGRSCRCGASLLRRVRKVNLHTLTGIRASLHKTARAEMTVPEVAGRPSRSAGRADPARHRPPVTGLPGARVPLGSFFRRSGRGASSSGRRRNSFAGPMPSAGPGP